MKDILQRKVIDENKLIQLSKEINIDKRIIKLLLMRNLDNCKKINSFLDCSINNLEPPESLKNMKIGKDLVNKYIKNNKSIVIYGDYDCDGIGAVAILYKTMEKLNAKVNFHIPQRHNEGYGLSKNAIDNIKNDYNVDLIITVDCGITAIEEVAYAKTLDIEILITDHHKPFDTLPDTICINPYLNNNENPLCGAGVALKLCEELTSKEFAMSLLDICAISTIADIVPLLGDNRIIAKIGLENIKKGNCNDGLKRLLGKLEIKDIMQIKSNDIAYKVAPILNASGRISNADKSLRLLIENDSTLQNILAEELIAENNNRKKIYMKVLEDALKKLECFDFSRNYIIMLYSKDWDEGVIGIAAAKICENFCRPTILFTEKHGFLKGSARSISNINIYDILNENKNFITKFGGHSMAAGLSIKKENFSDFFINCNLSVKKNYYTFCFDKEIVYDEKINIEDIDLKFVNSLQNLEPFGYKNPKPVFFDIKEDMKVYPIGKYPHIKSKIGKNELIAFNKIYLISLMKNLSTKNLFFYIDKEIYKNKEKIVCNLKEITFKNYDFNDKKLFQRYLSYFVSQDTYKKKIKKILPFKESNFGTLFICFSSKKFLEYCKENIDLKKIVFNTDDFNPYNSIVLSPDKDFDFSYYNQIIFLEKPPKKYLIMMDNAFDNVSKVSDEINFETININLSKDFLRQDYIFFYSKLQNVSYMELESLFNLASSLGYQRNYENFCVSFYVFLELDLLKICNSGRIEINNRKVDIEESTIFQYVSNR